MSNPRILIVDDNPTNLKLATDILEGMGCAVRQAADAEQAQALLAQLTPDLILMDIALPGMDGLTLTRLLKADAEFKHVPIVALTASAMKGDDLKARDAGCEGYITKPIDTRKFAQQIFAFLPVPVETTQINPMVASGEKSIVLIVDDYAANRALLRAGLEGEGFLILEGANGVQALEVLENEHVDAVISDILMPKMDGFRLCHEIRKSGKPYSSVPFILYTATYDSPGDRQLAATIGADGYLLKPAPVPVILEALREAHLKAGGAKRPWAPRPGEAYVLEQYNAALVRKLEERNKELQLTLGKLQAAHEQILELNRLLELRVAQRTAALDAANKELESFSYSVAHDLRAPLRHISGFADLIRESAGTQLNEECGEYIGKIMRAAERMDRLIHDLLAFSRSARTELQTTEIELETILEESIGIVQEETKGRNIEWRRERLPRVRGDAALLRQVFVNLLSNAIKYSRSRDPAVIEIGCHAGKPHEAVVFVRDNGVGFDMNHAGMLFGVFQRLHSANEYEGTGIGLANAQRIVTRHGGRIWAEAAVDRGATFYVSLPAA